MPQGWCRAEDPYESKEFESPSPKEYRAEYDRDTLSSNPESNSDRLSCRDCVCECRFSPGSPMLKSDGLNSATEDSVRFVQLLERRVQRRNDFLCLIGGDDEFDIDFLV